MTEDEREARIAELEGQLKELKARRPKQRKCGMATAPDGLRYWLPECWGGVIYGDKAHCHCPE